jgi:hypothetical protein
MINLVPPKAKKSIQIEYWLRVLTTWLFLWSFALVCGAAALIPAYVLIETQSSVYETSAAEVSQKIADYNLASTALIRSSQQARYVLDERDVISISSLISLIESLQDADIQLTDIAINRTDKAISPIKLGGVASNRQALASFRDVLLEQTSVKDVDLPISNLARDKDIPFSITVTIANEQTI